MIRSFADLVAAFTGAGIEHRVDPHRQLLEVPSSELPAQGAVLVVWRTRPTVELVHLFGWRPAPDQIAGLLETIAIRNHTRAIGGFGFDHARACAYARLVVARVDGALDPAVLGAGLAALVAAVRDDGPALRAAALDQGSARR